MSADRPEKQPDPGIPELISIVKPRPGTRFYERIDNQPWNRKRRLSMPVLRFGVSFSLIVALILGITFFSPTLEAVAGRIAQLFLPAAEAQKMVEINPQDLTAPLDRFNLTVKDAEKIAGFALRLPASIPGEYQFYGAYYNKQRETVTSSFTSQQLGEVLRISQHRLDSQDHLAPEYQSIAPGVPVEIVDIGPLKGEFVIGSWAIPEVKSGAETDLTTITVEAHWDPNAPLQILRWSDDEFIFEIVYGGQADGIESFDKNDLIAIAISMQ